jgi:hypothetical protein
VNPFTLRFNPTRIVVVTLIIMVVVGVMFGMDLLNGRWDEPLLQPHPAL